MQNIFNKLAKANKRSTSVKHKVDLSMLNDIQAEAEDIFNNMQDAGNDAMDGIAKTEQSLGFLQGNIDRAKDLRQIKDEMLQQVLDLGIDVPQNLENLDTFIEDILLFDDFESQNDKLQSIKEYVNNVFFT